MRQIVINTIKKRGLLFLKLAVQNASLAAYTPLQYESDNAIYVVTSSYHKSMACYKIGMTTVGIDSRIKSLRYYTQEKPRLITWIYCDNNERENPEILEYILHKIFLRGSGLGREWFRLFAWDLHWIEKLRLVSTKKLEHIIMSNDEQILIQSIRIKSKALTNLELLDKSEKTIFDVGNLGESVIRNNMIYYRKVSEL